MSKITNVSESTFILKQQQTGSSEDKGFKEALDAALESTKDSVAATGSTNSLGEIQPTTTLNGLDSSSEDILDKTNFLIDKLENFSKDLEDPEKSLKDIEPLIAAIKDDAESLAQESIDADDDALNKIATETAIKASTEYYKFNRGDYI